MAWNYNVFFTRRWSAWKIVSVFSYWIISYTLQYKKRKNVMNVKKFKQIINSQCSIWTRTNIGNIPSFNIYIFIKKGIESASISKNNCNLARMKSHHQRTINKPSTSGYALHTGSRRSNSYYIPFCRICQRIRCCICGMLQNGQADTAHCWVIASCFL